MAAPPYFNFYPQAFLSATHDMSAEEVGGYIRLLSHQWDRGALPSDSAKLSRLAGCNGNALAMLLHKFKKGEDGNLRNERLEMERDRIAEISKQQSEKAIRRWRTPSTEPAKLIAALFHRRLDTEWSEKEVRAYKKLATDCHFNALGDLELVGRYMEAERKKKEHGKHRRDLYTFLNNYPGEVDRAREWSKRLRNPPASNADRAQPPGWSEWLQKNYPTAIERNYWKVAESVQSDFKKGRNAP